MIKVVDVGDGYNNHDGIFDVPVAGIYVLTFTIYANYNHKDRTELVIDGQVKTAALADAYAINNYHTSTATIVVSANAGDHVFFVGLTSNQSVMCLAILTEVYRHFWVGCFTKV